MASPEQRTNRFHKIFVDLPFFWAFWAGSKAFCKHYYDASLALFSGTSTLRKHAAEKPAQPVDQSSSQAPKMTKVPVDITPISSASGISQQAYPQSSTRPRPLDFLQSFLPKPQPDSALKAASQAFREAFLRSWIKASNKLVWPPGTCSLKGEVDVQGRRGKVRMRTVCIYHPGDNVILAQVTDGYEFYPKDWVALGDLERKIKEQKSSKD